jgi:reductive dehalogenase
MPAIHDKITKEEGVKIGLTVRFQGEQMVLLLIVIAAAILMLQAMVGLAFFVSSIYERENRAALLGGLQFAGMLTLMIIFFLLLSNGFFKTGGGLTVLIIGDALAVTAVFLLTRRTGANPTPLEGTKGLIVGQVRRFDEREIVFARNRYLKPETENYEKFYREHPEYEEYDANRRAVGDALGNIGAIDHPHEGPNRAAIMASALFPRRLAAPDIIKPRAADNKIQLSPEEATERVKGFALRLGADLVGVTEINPLWIYSHRGMAYPPIQEDWGVELEVKHKYAIVFAVEMSLEMVRAAPHTPSAMESLRKYGDGASVAVQLAAFIANLGYSATANHLSYYEGNLVPMAVDAGLGEVGRIGYLMTREFGARQRLGAVTTDLPLIPDRPVDIGVKDFCDICKKCAVCCPTNSIPDGDRREVNGTLRWKLDAESCFEYWGKVGTECCICMRVCPWSHARTFPHRLIVWLISRNRASRRIFSYMDDIFYGRKPKSKSPPPWAKFTQWQQ